MCVYCRKRNHKTSQNESKLTERTFFVASLLFTTEFDKRCSLVTNCCEYGDERLTMAAAVAWWSGNWITQFRISLSTLKRLGLVAVSCSSDSGTWRDSLRFGISWRCWFCRCRFSWFFDEKFSGQPSIVHGNKLPSACRRRCRFSWISSWKNVGQIWQPKLPRGAICVFTWTPCVPRCWFNCVTVWYLLGQWLHTYCWILWWVFMWQLRLVTCANDRPQSGSMHTNGRSPVCIRRWLLRFVIWVNALPQSMLKWEDS